MIPRLVIPKLAHGYRFQWEEAQQAHVLLYPEGMVKLNRSAGEILARCDGKANVADITAALEQAFGAQNLGPEVTAFLDMAANNGWVKLGCSS